MCLMVQLWAPTSIQSQLPGATKLSALSLHPCFCHQASQAVEKLYCARRWATSSVIVKHLSLTVCEFCAEGKNAVSEATDWGMQTFCYPMSWWHLKHEHNNGLTFKSPHRKILMLASYIEELTKPHIYQNQGVGTCTEVCARLGQYSMCVAVQGAA